MASLPPAGWYPNPSGAPGQRYFDGRDWTAHHRATPQQPTAASPQPIPASRSLRHSRIRRSRYPCRPASW